MEKSDTDQTEDQLKCLNSSKSTAVFVRDPAERNTLEVRTTYPGIYSSDHAPYGG